MNDDASAARRGAARFLIGFLAALCLAMPLLAGPGEVSKEKSDAEKVARKLEKARGTAHQAEEDRDALRHFQEDVAEYADLHARQLAKLGSRVPADAQESAAAQKALAYRIQAHRTKAKPGDIFRADVQPFFRRLIAEQLTGPDTLDARKAVRDGNPPLEPGSVQVAVRVNAAYALGAPLSTVPPSLLLTLPALPAALEYRFVGRELILLDSMAGLIVDFMPAAAPSLGTN
jgi:hypothetical protein